MTLQTFAICKETWSQDQGELQTWVIVKQRLTINKGGCQIYMWWLNCVVEIWVLCVSCISETGPWYLEVYSTPQCWCIAIWSVILLIICIANLFSNLFAPHKRFNILRLVKPWPIDFRQYLLVCLLKLLQLFL